MNFSAAEAKKAKGNEAFSARNYALAIHAWTEAIGLVKKFGKQPGSQSLRTALHSNLAQGYLRISEDQWVFGDSIRSRYFLALNSAELALSIDGRHAKAHSRRARALHGLGLTSASALVANIAIQIDPRLKAEVGNLQSCDSAKQENKGAIRWQRLQQVVGAGDEKPRPRWHHSLNAVGDELYLLGGFDGGSSTTKQSMDSALGGHSCVEMFACKLGSGEGGGGGSAATWRRVHWRRFKCTRESALAEPPPNLLLHTAVVGPDKQSIYVFGGETVPAMPYPQLAKAQSGAAKAMDGLYQFTPKGNGGSWRRLGGNGASQLVKGPWPPARSSHVAAATATHMYVFGGITASGALLDDTWRFSFEEGVWEEQKIKSKARPPARAFASSAFDAVTDKWYVLAGCQHTLFTDIDKQKKWFSDVWELDVKAAKPKWKLLVAAAENALAMPDEGRLGGRAQATAFILRAAGGGGARNTGAVLDDDSSPPPETTPAVAHLCITGGYRIDGRYYSCVHALPLVDQSWASWKLLDAAAPSTAAPSAAAPFTKEKKDSLPMCPPPLGRCGATACSLENGGVLLTFGASDGEMLDDVYLGHFTVPPASSTKKREEEAAAMEESQQEGLGLGTKKNNRVKEKRQQQRTKEGHGGASEDKPRPLVQSHSGKQRTATEETTPSSTLAADVKAASTVFNATQLLASSAMKKGGHGGARFLAHFRKAHAAALSLGFLSSVFLSLHLARDPCCKPSSQNPSCVTILMETQNGAGLCLKWLGRFAEAEDLYWRALALGLLVPVKTRSAEFVAQLKNIANNVLSCYRPQNLTPKQCASLEPPGDRLVNNKKVAAALRILWTGDKILDFCDDDAMLAETYFSSSWMESHTKKRNFERTRQMAEQGVFTWNPETFLWIPQVCVCKKEETEPSSFKRCGGCKRVSYCSTGCQKKGWGEHKQSCKKWSANNEEAPPLPPPVEHLPDEPPVVPLARLCADLFCGAEDAAVKVASTLHPFDLRAPCLIHENLKFTALDVANLLGRKKALKGIAVYAKAVLQYP